VAGEGDDEVLQLEEETGEVRHGPKGVDGGDTAEHTEGEEEVVAAARNRRGAVAVRPPTRMRGRGKGRGACGVLRRENGGGWGKGCSGIRQRLLNGTVKGRGRMGGSGVGARVEEGEGLGGSGAAFGRPALARGRRARRSACTCGVALGRGGRGH
jgi:hypothetical protein